MTEPQLLTSPSQLTDMLKSIKSSRWIGIDTEFIRETSFFPRMALIQVANEEQIWLIDPTALDRVALEPFLNVLTNSQVLKIFHASHADQECFFWSYQIIAKPVLDTSIAAALCGMGESIGLQKLVREMLGVHLSKGRARAKWLSRPLSVELLRYAEQDVAHLVQLAKALQQKLTGLDRWEWALEESKTDPTRFDHSPEDVAMKLAKGSHLEKELGILEELVAWRETRAREANLPRGWVADNDVLISLARSKPRKLEDLKTFRGIHAKEIEKSGRTILEAIEKGKTKSVKSPYSREQKPEKTDPHALGLLEVFIKYLANKNQIMPRFLMNQQQLYQILQSSDCSISGWIEQGILSERSAALIGSDLNAFLQGSLTLQIKDKAFHCLSFDPDLTEK